MGNSYSVSEDFAIRLKESGWRVYTTSDKTSRVFRLLDILSTIWKHRDLYQIAQIDVYSGPAFIWAELAGWLLKRLQKPFVLTLHGGNLPQFSNRWPGRVRWLMNSAAIVTVPSRYLLETMQYYRQDLHLISNPLDLSAYKFRLRETPQPQLLWLRAFHAIYNPTMAPRILARLLLDFPATYLAMVGPDKGDGSLQATKRVAEDLGVLDRIKFPGGVPKKDVPKWLNKGDIFINTTNIDNTPVSVMEAMACGLCIVSTNVGGISYLLRDGVDALLVPPNDPQAMKDAIRRILTEPELAARLSFSARKRVEQYDWQVIFPKWNHLFDRVFNA
jgi:glycosyltransferase involved in cell wall biosynthesis